MRTNKKIPKYIIISIFIIVLYILTSDINFQELFPTTADNGQTLGEHNIQRGVVTQVIDGDDVVVDDSLTIRLIGIDAPGQNKCYGNEAALALEDLVLHQTVTLEKDISETDRYQRLFRYIWLDDTMINEQLVRGGYAVAKAYPPDTKYQDLLETAQNQAQEKQIGLWLHCPIK